MKKNLNKILAVALAVVTLALGIVVGTLAYLYDKSATVTNTFTVGEGVVITLNETQFNQELNDGAGGYETVTERTIEYIPGLVDVHKDPTMTVTGRECWVFVQVKVTEGFEDYITWAIDDSVWDITAVAEATADGFTTITYGKSTTAKTDDVLNVLKDKSVDFNNDVAEQPATPLTMTFTGYAIQTSDNYSNAADAWTALTAEPGFAA